MVERLTGRIPDQIATLARLKLRLLAERRSIFAHVHHLLEIEAIELELRRIVHPLSIFWRDIVDLRQIPFGDDGVVDVAEQLAGVGVQILPGGVVHHTLVQIPGLSVLADLALMVVVAFAGDDVVGHLVWSFRDIRTEFVGEAVRGVLLVA